MIWKQGASNLENRNGFYNVICCVYSKYREEHQYRASKQYPKESRTLRFQTRTHGTAGAKLAVYTILKNHCQVSDNSVQKAKRWWSGVLLGIFYGNKGCKGKKDIFQATSLFFCTLLKMAWHGCWHSAMLFGQNMVETSRKFIMGKDNWQDVVKRFVPQQGLRIVIRVPLRIFKTVVLPGVEKRFVLICLSCGMTSRFCMMCLLVEGKRYNEICLLFLD